MRKSNMLERGSVTLKQGDSEAERKRMLSDPMR